MELNPSRKFIFAGAHQNNVKEWVKCDDMIKDYEEKIKLLKQQKISHENNIYNYAVDNNKPNLIIKITNGNLKFVKQNIQQPLTYTFLKSCLSDKFSQKDVDSIVHYIKEKRTIKENISIKRFYF